MWLKSTESTGLFSKGDGQAKLSVVQNRLLYFRMSCLVLLIVSQMHLVPPAAWHSHIRQVLPSLFPT